MSAPEIKIYEPIQVVQGRECNECLDAVKSLPEFNGSQEQYVSWRQAAMAAYELFKPHEGSSRHYLAVLIIRNRIRESADAALASFNTVLNFDAIVARLDFTYSDKRPLHLLEQELATLRQGPLSIIQFYEEVEKKLTLLTNKTTMTHETQGYMNEKHRADALRVFVSGLRRNLTDVLFAAQPRDLPSALAMAQEIESNHDRHAFAAQYARSLEDKATRQTQGPMCPNDRKQDQVEKMEVDSSSRSRQPTNFQRQAASGPNQAPSPAFGGNQQQSNQKRPASSQRVSDFRRQRVNHLRQEDQEEVEYEEQYAQAAEEVADEIEADNESEYETDALNFLAEYPCSRSSNEQ